MPWIDDSRCTSCGVCVEECPAGAIVMEDSSAEIRMEDCIRCGICHDVCNYNTVVQLGKIILVYSNYSNDVMHALNGVQHQLFR